MPRDNLHVVYTYMLVGALFLVAGGAVSYVMVASLGRTIGVLAIALALYSIERYCHMIRARRDPAMLLPLFAGCVAGAVVGSIFVLPGAQYAFA